MSSEQAEKNPEEKEEKEKCASPSSSPAGLQVFTSVAAAANDIYVSADCEDKVSPNVEVKLHVNEKVWSPACIKVPELPEEQAKTEELYRKVRGILNRLTPETFETLMTQVQSLLIDNLERLQGVVNLVFDKAILSGPRSCECYAQMCKLLSSVKVPANRIDEDSPVGYVKFQKLIVILCQQEFENNSKKLLNKADRLKEITVGINSEMKKELQLKFEEESRKVHMKSLGSIRFIGELFKLKMLTISIMHLCIRQLLIAGEEESLECLCVLLTVIGKDLEVKNQDLTLYFDKMKHMSQKRGEICSRVRFMLQDVIELRQNKWAPRRDENNPKTIHQIRKEVEKDGVMEALSKGPLSSNQIIQNRSDGHGRQNCPQCLQEPHTSFCYIASHGGGDDSHGRVSVTPAGEDTSRGGPEISILASGVPIMTDDQVRKKTLVLLDEYFSNFNESETVHSVMEIFGEANIGAFVLESLNSVLEKSVVARQYVGKLMCHLINEKVITNAAFCTSFSQVISDSDDLAIDIPKIWLYLADIIVPLLSAEVVSFSEFRNLVKGVGKLVVETLQLLVKEKGPAWIRERWPAAGPNWTDIVHPSEVDSFVKQNKLEFTLGDGVPSQLSAPLSMEEVQKKLLQFLKPEQGSAHSFNETCDWIGANVGERVKEPQFIRALMTALCESAILQSSKLKRDVLVQHGKFFHKYIYNKEKLELQCLYAVQALVNRLQHPQGLLCNIFKVLSDNDFISRDSFIAWESNTDPCEQVGKGVALKSVTSFFTALRKSVNKTKAS